MQGINGCQTFLSSGYNNLINKSNDLVDDSQHNNDKLAVPSLAQVHNNRSGFEKAAIPLKLKVSQPYHQFEQEADKFCRVSNENASSI